MTEFTPLQSLVGGMLIGLSAVMMMALNGRITGVSGVVSKLLPPVEANGLGWRAAFIAGLMLSSFLLMAAGLPVGSHTVTANLTLVAVAGVLVGLGSVLGSGCTSGHGVCGLSRFSWRSLVATLTFMTTGAITVFVARHVIGG